MNEASRQKKINLFFCSSLILFAFLFLQTSQCQAETITLKSGQKIDGEIIERTEKYIKIDVSGVPTTYFIDEIQGGESYVNEGKDSKKAIEKRKATPRELAEEARESSEYFLKQPGYVEGVRLASEGKSKEANELFIKVLSENRSHVYSKSALKILDDAEKGIIKKETAILISKGELNFINKKYREAVGCFEEALKLNADYPEIYGEIGRAYLALEQYKQAILYMQKAIEIAPRFAQCYVGLGAAYEALGEFDNAKKNLLRAAALFQKEGDDKMVKSIMVHLEQLPDQLS